MTENPHLPQPVATMGAPLEDADAVIIAVHGRDRDPDDILADCRRIGLGRIACLAPAAHGKSWYPAGFMMPLAENEPYLTFTLESIASVIDTVRERGVHQERIVLLGFSQGACAIAEYAVRHPARYGGIIIFTGGFIGPPGTKWGSDGEFRETPVLISGSERDDWVPFERMIETRDIMQRMGAAVQTHFYTGTDHFVTDTEITAARDIIAPLRG